MLLNRKGKHKKHNSVSTKPKYSGRAGKRYLKQLGTAGEEAVTQELMSKLGNGYLVLSDIMLKGNSGYTTQIDHIVLSIYGIFVIETKNYSGTVYGSANDMYWQHINRAGVITKMYNPIRQNNGHIKTLAKVLDMGYERIVNNSCDFVVFSNKTNLSLNLGVYASKIVPFDFLVRSIHQYTQIRFTEQEVWHMYGMLKTMNMKSKYSRNKHNKQVEALNNRGSRYAL